MTNTKRHTLKTMFWIAVIMKVLILFGFNNFPSEAYLFIAPIMLTITSMTIVVTVAIVWTEDLCTGTTNVPYYWWPGGAYNSFDGGSSDGSC